MSNRPKPGDWIPTRGAIIEKVSRPDVPHVIVRQSGPVSWEIRNDFTNKIVTMSEKTLLRYWRPRT